MTDFKSAGALGVSSGIILLIIAVSMVLGPAGSDADDSRLTGKDPMRLAVFPLAVPYLLNPAGIVVLVTASPRWLFSSRWTACPTLA